MVKNILRLAVPNGMENGMFQVGKLIVQGLISSFGTAAIAANAIGNSLASMANIPGAAMGLGLVTVVGQCVGARDYVQAEKYTKKIMAVTYLSLGAFNVILFLTVGTDGRTVSPQRRGGSSGCGDSAAVQRLCSDFLACILYLAQRPPVRQGTLGLP